MGTVIVLFGLSALLEFDPLHPVRWWHRAQDAFHQGMEDQRAIKAHALREEVRRDSLHLDSLRRQRLQRQQLQKEQLQQAHLH